MTASYHLDLRQTSTSFPLTVKNDGILCFSSGVSVVRRSPAVASTQTLASRSAGPNNIVQSFRTGGISLVSDDDVIRCTRRHRRAAGWQISNRCWTTVSVLITAQLSVDRSLTATSFAYIAEAKHENQMFQMSLNVL
jgi:hypothetical protein